MGFCDKVNFVGPITSLFLMNLTTALHNNIERNVFNTTTSESANFAKHKMYDSANTFGNDSIAYLTTAHIDKLCIISCFEPGDLPGHGSKELYSSTSHYSDLIKPYDCWLWL